MFSVIFNRLGKLFFHYFISVYFGNNLNFETAEDPKMAFSRHILNTFGLSSSEELPEH